MAVDRGGWSFLATPLPPADAVVSVGHVLNYLPDEAAIDQALPTNSCPPDFVS